MTNQAEEVVGVIGTGTMGSGIAQVAAKNGHAVLMYDVRSGAAESAIATTSDQLAKLVAKGKMDPAAKDELVSRLQPVKQLSELAPAGLVIEAIQEDLSIKRNLFAELENVVAEDAILATNTSSLSVTAIAAGLKSPSRVCGMHFFNPAQTMPLVEIVTGLATSPAVSDKLMKLATSWGKNAVLARSTPGFIVNRVARPFYAEALRVVQEGGADIATIDAVMRESGGFRMGPFELMDFIGHDVNFAVTRSVHAAYFGDPRFTPSIIQQELVEAGRLGKKTGIGFYDYSAGALNPQPNEAPEGPKPSSVSIDGNLGPAEALVPLIEAAGIRTKRQETSQASAIVVDGVHIVLTDGTTATSRSNKLGVKDLVCFDLALDYRTATRIAVAAAKQSSKKALSTAAGLLQATGKRVSVFQDIPGLMVMRTVAMLANEAADTVLHTVTSVEGVDVAMQKGTNYPQGPLKWCDKLGASRVVAVLDGLVSSYGDPRYRASLYLRTLAESDRNFYE